MKTSGVSGPIPGTAHTPFDWVGRAVVLQVVALHNTCGFAANGGRLTQFRVGGKTPSLLINSGNGLIWEKAGKTFWPDISWGDSGDKEAVEVLR